MIKTYYKLTKPGIVYGNVFTTLASFLYASHWKIVWPLFAAALFGIALVIASACVFNNYLDRDIDKKMARTQQRGFAAGTVSYRYALLFGAALGAIGFLLLYYFVNHLSAFVAAGGFLVYVLLYTFAKRATHWATPIGSISGAVPIVVGYTAISNMLDETALMLFLILVVWQMPHFYAIAIYRAEEYAAAGIPVLPLVKNIKASKVQILLYVLAFFIAVLSLTSLRLTGWIYFAIMLFVGLAWLTRSVEGFWAYDDVGWAKALFKTSLVVLVLFCIALAVSPLVP